MPKTTAARHATLNALLRDGSQMYAALHSGAPGSNGDENELVGAGYARAAVTFAAPSAGSAASSGIVTFPTPSAAWAEATHLSIWDASTAGACVYYEQLAQPVTAQAGVPLVIPSGAVVVSES